METLKLEFKEFDFIEEEAFASVSLNPTFRWCKFVLTDDKPNGNKQRIPLEEFDNLIRTGINAPIKMATSEIKEGHEDSIPLGVITALKKENNYVTGLAALWAMERPEDVNLIKQRYEKGEPLNLSWEVLYLESSEEEDGVTALRDTALRATTFVGRPAYAGRTPMLEFASTKEDNSNLEDTTLEIEELKAKVTELETALAEKNTELDTAKSALDTLKTENESLAAFKQGVEEEKAVSEKFSAIKVKFQEAGLEKNEDYFESNKEKLLGMEETVLDFMVQELVSFASELKDKKESKASSKLPVINLTTDGLDPKELGRKLRENR